MMTAVWHVSPSTRFQLFRDVLLAVLTHRQRRAVRRERFVSQTTHKHKHLYIYAYIRNLTASHL